MCAGRERVKCVAHRPEVKKGYESKDIIRNAYPETVRSLLIRGYESLMVNPAIVDGENRPTDAPWLVDLKLPIVLSY